MALSRKRRTLLTGGTSDALDGIDGNTLNDGDICEVFASNIWYCYVLDADSGAAESSPDIIAPDTNPGSKRHILQSIRVQDLTISDDLIINDDLTVSGDISVTGNDWRLGNIRTLGSSGCTTFAEAIAISGSYTLMINQDYTMAADANIPARIVVDFCAGAKVTLGTYNLIISNFKYDGIEQCFNENSIGAVTFKDESCNYVRPEWWGSKTASNINNAFNSYNIVKCSKGNYIIEESIFIPVYGKLLGDAQKTYFYPTHTGTYVNNYVILYNSINGTGWVDDYPLQGGEINGIRFEGYADGNYCEAIGIFIAGACCIQNCVFYKMQGGIYTSGDYADHKKIDNCSFQYSNGVITDYDINIAGLGDALTINNCQITSGSTNGLKIYGCLGGSISSCILNCNIIIDTCSHLSINTCHNESGYIDIDSSNISIENTCLNKYASGVSLEIDGSSLNQSTVLLNNVNFYLKNNINYNTEYSDIDYYNSNVVINNVYRKYNVIGAIDHNYLYGIKISNNGVALDEFNNYSHFLSNSCFLINQINSIIENFLWNKKIIFTPGVWYPLTYLQTTSIETWLADTGTYYYRSQIIADFVRKIGKTETNENSIALTNGGNGLLFPLSDLNKYSNNNIIFRIYRGNSSGLYNYYIDLPLIYAKNLYDDGNNICGYTWKTRTPGAVDSLQTYDINEINIFNSTLRGTTVPTVGTWYENDKIINTSITSGGNLGWICISSGTFGIIDPVFEKYGLINLEQTIIWDPNNLNDGDGDTSPDITITGAALGDYCLCSNSYNLQNVLMLCYVKSSNTAVIRLQNESGGIVNLGSGNWKIKILK